MALVCAGGLFAGGGAGDFVDDFRGPNHQTGAQSECTVVYQPGTLARIQGSGGLWPPRIFQEIEKRPQHLRCAATSFCRVYFFRSFSNFAITSGFLPATFRVSPGSVFKL